MTTPTSLLRPPALLAACLFLLAFRPPAALAVTQTWLGTGINGDWNTTGNFSPSGPYGVTSADDLQFDGSNYLTNNFNNIGYANVLSITFNAGAGAFTLQGYNLGTYYGVTNLSSNLQTISLNGFWVSGTQTWDAGTGGLRITSPVVFSLLFSQALTVTGSGNTSIEGNMTEFGDAPDPSFRGSLIKAGMGTLTLSGSNSYRGGTYVQDGVLRAGNAAAFVQNTGYQVNGGTLDLNGFNLTTAGFSGTGGLVALGAGTLTVDQFVATIYDGGITGTGGLTLKGGGGLTLTGTNNYSGATRVEGFGTTLTIGGTNFSGTSALTVEANSWLVVGTNFASFPTVSFGSIAGAGYIKGNSIISGFAWGSDNTSTTFGGTMFGTILASKQGTGTTTFTGSGNDIRQMIINSGGIRIGSGGVLGNTAVSLFGSTNTSATLDLDGNDLEIKSLIGTADSFVTLGSGTLTLRGNTAVPTAFSGVISGGGGLVKNGGTYVLTLDGDNTYTGKTTVNAGTLRIGTSGTNSTGRGSVAGDIENYATLIFSRDNAYSYVGAISGTGTVLKEGQSTLTLTGSNSYTGGTTISVGALQIGDGGTAGSITGNVTNNAALIFNRSDNVSFGGGISGTGAVTKTGAGTVTLTAGNSYEGGTHLTAGALALGNNAALGTGTLTIGSGTALNKTGANRRITNAIVVGGDFKMHPGSSGVFELDGGMDLAGGNRTIVNTANFFGFEFGRIRFGGVISNGGLIFADNGYGAGDNVVFFTMDGSGANTYTGETVVGTNVSLSLAKDAGVTAIAGNATIRGEAVLAVENSEQIADTSKVRLEGNGLLQLGVGTAVTETIGELEDDGGGMAEVSLGNAGSGSRLRVGGGSFSGAVTGGAAGGVSLEKIGSGTLVLGGNNAYLGDTTVGAGALLVNGTNSGLGSVTVKSGAALGGTGSILGHVTVEDGGILAPGASAGTLSVGSLILNSASELKFELGTASDLVVVAGDLTLAGILDVTQLTGFGAGSYTLFEYGGTLTDQGLTFGLMPTGFLYAIDLSTTGYVKLTVAPPDLYWDGPNTTPDGTVNGGTGTWNNTSSNWTTVNGLVNFIWNEVATAYFTSTPGTVTVVETVDVAEMNFETDGYVVTGPGEIAISGPTLTVNTATNVTAEIGAVISGAGGLVKNGDEGTLILSADNTYTGDTLIDGGTLRVGNGGTTGSILGNVTNNGTLDFNRAGDLTFGGVISGSGDLKVTGTGTVTLTASNSYAGGTMLDKGTLLVADDDALGTGTLHLADGTTFGVVPAGDVVLGNSVVINGDVKITADFLSFLDFTGPVDLGAATRTLTFTENGSMVCFMGAISGEGGLTLGMAGSGMSGVVTFCGSESNTYAGLTTVGADVELSLEKDPGVTAIAGDVQVDVGGSLKLFDTSEQINPASTVTINGIMGILAISGTTTQTIGNLQGTGAIINIFGPSILTVNSGSFGGTIMDGAADPLALVKSSTGTLTLGGANDYRGGTKITAGTLRTLDPSALGTGPVELSGGTLAPGGTLTIASLDWLGGSIALSLGTATDFLGITGDLTLDGDGWVFDFTDGVGFAPNTLYTILGAANLDDTFPSLFSGNDLFGLAPVFSRSGSDLLVNFTGSSTGPLLQNIGGPWTPVTADFLVSGPVETGAPADSNTVNSLIFDPDGRLRVHNNLTVTGGRFDVGSGRGTVRGGNVWTPADFEKTGDGILDIDSNVQVGGAAAIRNGRLYVNGRFAAPGGLTVFQNTLLGGNGVIVGNVFNNGTLAPGNSPGTTTVVGNFTQSSIGTTELEIASQTLFDRLLVSGSANLAGTLKVINYGGNQIAYGQQYAFLQAAVINGEFDRILMPDPGRFRGRFWANGGTGTLIVAPTSYTLVAVTGNQRNVARALDSYIPARGDDRETVSIALDMLGGEQYPAAFDQIAPTFHESVANIAIEQAFAQVQLLNQRMSSVRLGTRAFQTAGIEAEPLVYDKGGKRVVDPKDLKTVITEDEAPKWSLWTQGNGMFAKTTSVNQVPGYRTDGGGVLFGTDYTFGDASLVGEKPALTTGFFGGYQGLYAKYDGGGNTTMNSAVFGTYVSFTKGGFYADGVVSGGYNNFNVRRPIKFSTIDRTARSLQDSGQFAAALNLGHDWQAGKFMLGPILGAQYTYVGIAPFTERGADSLDLRLTQQNANSLRTTLGGRIAYTWKLSDTVAIIPEGRMFWLHEFMNNPRAIGATLDGGSGPGFNYMTAEPYRDSVFCGAGVTTQFGENLTASAYWNIDFGRPDYIGQAVSLNLGWKF